MSVTNLERSSENINTQSMETWNISPKIKGEIDKVFSDTEKIIMIDNKKNKEGVNLISHYQTLLLTKEEANSFYKLSKIPKKKRTDEQQKELMILNHQILWVTREEATSFYELKQTSQNERTDEQQKELTILSHKALWLTKEDATFFYELSKIPESERTDEQQKNFLILDYISKWISKDEAISFANKDLTGLELEDEDYLKSLEKIWYRPNVKQNNQSY